MHALRIFLSVAILVFSAFITGCNNSQQYEISAGEKYEKTQESLKQAEQKNPVRFLVVSGNNKKNLLGQTVVKGTIYNNAKIVSYKDVDIKLSFYSKTGALLEEDHQVVYESISPGGSKSFKSKFFTPKGTDSVYFTVIGAKF